MACPKKYLLCVSDFGHSSDRQRLVSSAMANHVSSRPSPPHCVLAAGDNFYPRGVRSVHDPQWQSVFVHGFMLHDELRVPWYAALGNHDYEGETDAQIMYSNHSANPLCLADLEAERNAKCITETKAADEDKDKDMGRVWRMPGKCYSFVTMGGKVQVFVLDTNGAQLSVRRS